MSEWQPISTAPKDGTWVLLTGGNEFSRTPVGPCVVAFWDRDDWVYAYWDGDWYSAYENATHWMAIPKGPE